MRKQYIIEVDESKIVEGWNEQTVKEIGYQEYALKQCPGIKVKPYNPAGDLISREALKDKLTDTINVNDITKSEWYEGYAACVQVLSEFIDSAQAVPERDYSQGWHDAITKALNEAYTITSEDGSFKVVQTETLEGLGMSMPMPKRPQGEWVDSPDGLPECCCNLCGAKNVTIWRNFCPNCGADMWKGGAE